jgi:hypothetical protein
MVNKSLFRVRRNLKVVSQILFKILKETDPSLFDDYKQYENSIIHLTIHTLFAHGDGDIDLDWDDMKSSYSVLKNYIINEFRKYIEHNYNKL